jgi:hypothetical protein
MQVRKAQIVVEQALQQMVEQLVMRQAKDWKQLLPISDAVKQ